MSSFLENFLNITNLYRACAQTLASLVTVLITLCGGNQLQMGGFLENLLGITNCQRLHRACAQRLASLVTVLNTLCLDPTCFI